MRAFRLAGVLFCGGVLGSCNALDAYPTSPRALAEVPYGAPPHPFASMSRVGICYNTLTTSLAEVREQAQRECPVNTVAEPSDTDWYMQNCPLLLPARGTFICRATKPVNAPVPPATANTPATPTKK